MSAPSPFNAQACLTVPLYHVIFADQSSFKGRGSKLYLLMGESDKYFAGICNPLQIPSGHAISSGYHEQGVNLIYLIIKEDMHNRIPL